jgi:hypothetical protein
MEQTVNIRCTNGFFVRSRGIVCPGETVQLLKSEAQDVVAATRGEVVTLAEFNSGPKADFKPKDAEGREIPQTTMTRAQMHAAARAQQATQTQPRERLSLNKGAQ